MINRYLLSFIAFFAVLSCTKEKQRGTYIVNAARMIALTGNNWNNVESQLSLHTGYRYSIAPANSGIKAIVDLPALDDSTRTVSGKLLLNIATDNRVQFASFSTDPIAQPVAYEMMLSYNNASLQSISGITSSMGELVENGAGGNPPVATVLSKLISGQIVEKLAISYQCTQGRFTMVIFRQNDGRFIFSYRGAN
jgi:hypothetical protein